MSPAIGRPLERVDGRSKVTGQARYPTEVSDWVPPEDIAYAALVQSTVARGRIGSMDTTEAEAATGVLAVITHRNAPRLERLPGFAPGDPPRPLPPGLLQDAAVSYSGEHVGIVVADTLERATHAASLVRVGYGEEEPAASFDDGLVGSFVPEETFAGPPEYSRGRAEEALDGAPVRVDEVYTTPPEHQNPMGPTATTAVWDGDRLTVYDTTQGVSAVRQTLAGHLGIPVENVRVVARFVGGGFGATLLPWPHTVLAAVAAREVGRPVRLTLSRAQMYTAHGPRPRTRQRVALGAAEDGRLRAIVHEATTDTARYADRDERVTGATNMLYACPNVRTARRLVRLDMITPTTMRAPGEATGVFALEVAMDELAHGLGMDPVELRLRNYAEETDPETGLPWSTKSLRACYELGADRFGWGRRSPEPRSMRDEEGYLVGMGMASGVYPYLAEPSAAAVNILADGSVVARSGVTDIGPGTSTVMTQIAADALGLPPEGVRFEWGDTRLPEAPTQGGSRVVISVGPAVQQAARKARENVLALARGDERSPLRGIEEGRVSSADGRLFLTDEPSRGETYAQILKRNGLDGVEGSVVMPPPDQPPPEPEFSTHAFGAQFAEVRVDPELGEVRLRRFVGAYGAGRIINERTARSQMVGGIIGGIGMALTEQTRFDPNVGRYTNANLWGYMVPTNADVGDIEALFVEENDLRANPLGAKGLAEICLVGVAAAIANAVYHATGRRVRDLPIIPDRLV